jgi:acetyl-CoA carboxylase biotin carboxyl carrier protein
MAIIVADMAGTVFKVLVAAGDDVTQGQEVVVLESMKMEVPVASTAAGRVVRVAVAEGDFVNQGDTLMELA